MGDAWSLRIVCVRSIGCHRPPDEGAEIGGRVDVHYTCRGGSPEGRRVAEQRRILKLYHLWLRSTRFREKRQRADLTLSPVQQFGWGYGRWTWRFSRGRGDSPLLSVDLSFNASMLFNLLRLFAAILKDITYLGHDSWEKFRLKKHVILGWNVLGAGRRTVLGLRVIRWQFLPRVADGPAALPASQP